MADSVRDYVVRIVGLTRESPQVQLGASPRGSLAVYRAAQAMAALQGRDFVSPDDVKKVAVATLAHRIIPRLGAASSSTTQVVRAILDQVPVPDAQR